MLIESNPLKPLKNGTRGLEIASSSLAMSTMTTAVRGTPNLTVAPTQNTAPVFEFRCLYTHDLRKKKKIWHDGSLRFHTFNRRVLVYDDSKNYIGDAHWRETGEFQEGEELKLDKGVMVEVGEQIGHTETDLAPIILEKRRPENACSPTRAPPSNTYSSALRPPSTISQARPKSLAAVLRASQGPIGRARLPTRSPFEQRQDNIRQQLQPSTERPAKKPRTAVEKENVVYNSNPVGQRNRATPHTSARPEARKGKESPREPTSANSTDPSKRSAESPLQLPASSSQHADRERARSHRETVSVAKNTRPPRLSTGTSTKKSASKLVENPNSTFSAPHQTSEHNSREYRLAAKTKDRTHVEAVTKDSAANAHASAGRVTNKLRFVTEKPRRKLIYKSPLPHDHWESDSRTGKGMEAQNRNRGNKKTRSKNSETGLPSEAMVVDLVSEGECDPPTTVQTSVRGRPEVVLNGNLSPLNASGATSRSLSPLFVDQSPRLQSLPASQKSIDKDFEPPRLMSPIQETVEDQRADLIRHPNRKSLVEDAENEDTLANQSEITMSTTILEVPSKLTLLGQKSLRPSSLMKSPLEQPPPQISPNQRPFRRILSETDAHLQTKEALPSRFSPRGTAKATATEAQQIPDVPQQIPAMPQQPFKSPSKMQRSISDTTHLLSRTEVSAREVPVCAAVEAGFDPWSEPEAYLLFDWWPPGKEKPPFVVVDET